MIAFLAELHRRNIRMCIATATDRYQVEAALQRCGMRHFFSEIFTCTEVGSGKDRPDIFRKQWSICKRTVVSLPSLKTHTTLLTQPNMMASWLLVYMIHARADSKSFCALQICSLQTILI